MAEMVVQWPVCESFPVGDGQRDADGFLSDTGIDELFARVRGVYLSACATLTGVSLEVQGIDVQRGSAAAPGTEVVVAVAVVEIFPDHFTMTSRMRADGPGVAATATCRVHPAGGVTSAIQTELIARAQAAPHFL